MKDNRQQIMTLAEQRVRLLYSDAYTQALKIAEVRKALDAATNPNFTFKANPRAEKELKKILQALGVNLDKLITGGKATMAKDGVKAAEDNILAIVAKSDKPVAERLIQAATATNRVAQALGTELANERRGGVKPSQNIWKTVESSRKELEIIIQNNIIEGKSADVASREVRQYLKDPNKLFRRVKDKETGEYKLSKAAQQYHPGRGKYRSSYMNARRLTVTEMNMATQAAESAAYASNPLIAGYEIRLSNNHTVKDPSKKGGVKPLHDICDELQGRYPATFKFTGWHPHCRCTMIPILISAEERRKLAKARAEGKDYQPKGVITDVPDNYKQWVAANQDRIADAKTLPFFLQDNGEMTKDGYEIGNFDNLDDVREKLLQLEQPIEQTAFVAFDPISPTVVKYLNERKDLKGKLKLFDEIINDERADVLSEFEKGKTVEFPGHKGSQHETWAGITKTAEEINKAGENVAFLPETGGGTRADALVLFHGRPVVADFKYCVTTKWNTLAGDLKEGFQQANTVVLKLENMDAGGFKDAVGYILRNNIPYGNIKLVNEYGKILEISDNDIRLGKYKKKIKGFL